MRTILIALGVSLVLAGGGGFDWLTPDAKQGPCYRCKPPPITSCGVGPEIVPALLLIMGMHRGRLPARKLA
jgi:hypothetical protein